MIKHHSLGPNRKARLKEELFVEQRGRCAICGIAAKRASDLYLDHDHATGYIRALLCNNCNIGLGAFVDNPFLLRRAIMYLRRHLKFWGRKRPRLTNLVPASKAKMVIMALEAEINAACEEMHKRDKSRIQ
jgi:hypothetical protein